MPVNPGACRHNSQISTPNATASTRPGMMPAMKRSPTDCSSGPRRGISSSDGGISIPSTDDPATTPVAKRGVWPTRSISGTATRANTAADAIEMPVIAANTVLAPTVARPNPPRIRRNARLATSKVSRPICASDTTSPISTNSGTTPKM